GRRAGEWFRFQGDGGCGRVLGPAGLVGAQGDEALVLLGAGRATGEVGAHAGHRLVGGGTVELELDVLVEPLEALVAAELGLAGPEQARQDVTHAASPLSARWARSLRRASWRVLYSAPRVVARRSARTSMGTPFSARATSTSRWCGVSALAIPSWTTASSSACSASLSGDDRSGRTAHASGSSGISRSRQASRRTRVAAS